MREPILKGMIAEFIEAGRIESDAEKCANRLYAVINRELFYAHDECYEELNSIWVQEIVAETLVRDFEHLGRLCVKAHLGDSKPIIRTGAPKRFYEHIPVFSPKYR